MPALLYIVFFVGMAILQFVAIFWFMSRGGVDTYMPTRSRPASPTCGARTTCSTKVQENIVFLEKPEEIESKGGHVPGGILLWGPPGTGKTLMAEAVAGETGKPYVFVDPGAFQNMFMGVGIMKVKALFRKLRKLALRYGGVIVFFDEADSLGNRGGDGLEDARDRPGRRRGVPRPALQRRALPVEPARSTVLWDTHAAGRVARRARAEAADPEPDHDERGWAAAAAWARSRRCSPSCRV